MLFVLFFFIVEVSCNLFYMNNIISPEKSPPPVLHELFYDQDHAGHENLPNFNSIHVPTAHSSDDASYDMQARKLLDYFDVNIKNLVPNNLLQKSTQTTKFVTTGTKKDSKTTTTSTASSTALTESTTNLPSSSTQNFNTTILTEPSFLNLETITFVPSTTDKINLAKTINKKVLDINETFKLDLGKRYIDQDFDCLTCRKIIDKSDCYVYALYDPYNLINTFCCQCNNNKKKKTEPESNESRYETLVIIVVIILVSLLFCGLFVCLSVWVYKLSKVSSDKITENESGAKKSETNSSSNDKNESMQENIENFDSESDKTSINTTDSLDMDRKDLSKRYTNLKNLNKNNNNSISQENVNRYMKKTRSRTPSGNIFGQDIVCDEFSNKSGTKLNYTIDYKVNNEQNVFDKRTCPSVTRKNYHSACTNLFSNAISENPKDRNQAKKINNNRIFVSPKLLNKNSNY
ncbi:hypothetical protein BpHYR1_053431 [Brachionus plicatilis]|uniref:Uncharacterized protein n=1 Tax=Brachionus plicatilis TaxID=10195 RepID=A0A3M7QHU3_BRAPC|nr:hypothetical protein BpHYR1_053431 [Brachionus plicatilis]